MQRIHAALGRRRALAVARSVRLVVPADGRAGSEAIVADRDRPREHAARARPVLLPAGRPGVATVARRAGTGGPALAAALRRGGGGRPPARQDREARRGAAGRRLGTPPGGAGLRRAAPRGGPPGRPARRPRR